MLSQQMNKEILSKSFAFKIINSYYPKCTGTFKLLKRHGILLSTGAVIRANRKKFYIEGSIRNINRTLAQHQ